MNIITFILTLLLLGFAFTWVFPLLMGPVLGLIMLTSRKSGDDAPPKSSTWVLLVAVFAANAYLLWGWAALVAHLTQSWSATPDVTQHWLYYITGFLGCVSPLASMAAHDTGETGSSMHIFLTSVAFIVFCIWPVAAIILYGWLPALFGKWSSR
jgi:hypothetical protein